MDYKDKFASRRNRVDFDPPFFHVSDMTPEKAKRLGQRGDLDQYHH